MKTRIKDIIDKDRPEDIIPDKMEKNVTEETRRKDYRHRTMKKRLPLNTHTHTHTHTHTLGHYYGTHGRRILIAEGMR